MPELPEVETVRRGLAPAMEGKTILRAEIRRDGLRWPFPPRLAERLTGQRTLVMRRRAKYILSDLSSGETLLWHLGMSGRVLILDGDGPAQPGSFHYEYPHLAKHDHVELTLEGGTRIIFNDVRRFGALDLAPTPRIDDHPLLANLGPEPLGNGFDGAYLATAFAGRNTPVKAALLDQRIVAGLGNIYVCEALHRTGISPKRKAGRLSAARAASLVPAIRDVLTEAIEAGGSSLRDYRQADGELGYFQHRFQAYGRAGEACTQDGCSGQITRIVQSGRSSFYCPTCQR